MLMSTHNRTVDEHFFKIGVTGQLRKEPMPNALPRPARKALVGAIPETELRRKVAPGTARARDPEYGLDKQTIVRCGSAWIATLTGQQRFDPRELIISQPKTYHPDVRPKVRI